MSEFTLEAALEVADSAVGVAVGVEAMFRLRRELENLRKDSKILNSLYAEGVDSVALALECAYDKGRRDEAAERDAAEEDDSWQDQEGFYTAMDILS